MVSWKADLLSKQESLLVRGGSPRLEPWGDVTPHFERYPLRSKKTRDFVIWKRLVLECKLKCINGKPTPEEVLAEATLLAQQLKEGRAYQEVEWVDYPRPGKGHRKNTPSCPKCGETDPTRFSKRPNDTYLVNSLKG